MGFRPTLACQAEEAFALHDEMAATISKLCAGLARKKTAGIQVCSTHVQLHSFVKVAGWPRQIRSLLRASRVNACSKTFDLPGARASPDAQNMKGQSSSQHFELRPSR